jgi:hypothetical protein
MPKGEKYSTYVQTKDVDLDPYPDPDLIDFNEFVDPDWKSGSRGPKMKGKNVLQSKF